MSEPNSQNLIWIDLEMTGLTPGRDVIIEIATLVTDAYLNIIAEGPVLAIKRSPEELALMDEWNLKTHTGSGLIERIQNASHDITAAEKKTLEFVRDWTPPNKSPLCGNSVPHDRRFLRIEMTELEAHFHYRSVDVSTIKELASRWYPKQMQAPAKQGAHKALGDIRESVEELRWYREHLFVASR
tara:strand:- start:2753 stop:3307 length:555 start_codon:yes stop_codon:yes gene_type:complete